MPVDAPGRSLGPGVGAYGMDVICWGNERARARPWRGQRHVVQLAPFRPNLPLSVGFVRRAMDELSSQGFTRVFTNALAPHDQAGFLRAGFEPSQRLHLLHLNLDDLRGRLPRAERRRLGTAGAADRGPVLRVDDEAFDPFWRLGPTGLDETLAATPRSRFRLGYAEGEVVAYAVTGRSGRQGFLQRMAVRPSHQRRGLGRALVSDGLGWLRRWRVADVTVNTPTDNHPALALYEGLGFRRQPECLSVLAAELPG
jgi:ribosomal protein S18 acetylase RimI-like enzyme